MSNNFIRKKDLHTGVSLVLCFILFCFFDLHSLPLTHSVSHTYSVSFSLSVIVYSCYFYMIKAMNQTDISRMCYEINVF
jgi:hypothetical protein